MCCQITLSSLTQCGILGLLLTASLCLPPRISNFDSLQDIDDNLLIIKRRLTKRCAMSDQKTRPDDDPCREVYEKQGWWAWLNCKKEQIIPKPSPDKKGPIIEPPERAFDLERVFDSIQKRYVQSFEKQKDVKLLSFAAKKLTRSGHNALAQDLCLRFLRDNPDLHSKVLTSFANRTPKEKDLKDSRQLKAIIRQTFKTK